MTATTVAGVGTRIGASENGVAAAVRRASRVERDAPLPVDEAREIYRDLPDVARPGPEALAVARALLGHDGPALRCVVPLTSGDGLPAQESGRLGLTPRADTARLALHAVFGKQILGGFSPRRGLDRAHRGVRALRGPRDRRVLPADHRREHPARLGTGASGRSRTPGSWTWRRSSSTGGSGRQPVGAGLARLPASRRPDGQPGAAARGPRPRRRHRGRLTGGCREQRSGHGTWRAAAR